MKILRISTGYTLVELLLYVAMLGILLSAVTYFFGTAADARIKNQTINEVNEQGAFLLQSMTQTIRGATSITTPAIGASGSSLTIVVPTSSLSPTTYSLSNGVMQIKEGTAAAVSLTNSRVQISSFTVTNLSRSGTKGIVQLRFTVSHSNPSARAEYDYSRTFTTSVGLLQ